VRWAEGRVFCTHMQSQNSPILRFHGVLDKESVAHVVVRDDVLHSEKVNAVQGHGAVVRLMHGRAADVAVMDVAEHMEVERVTPELERLTTSETFDVGHPADGGGLLAGWRGVEHHMSAVLV
jgi:hypothetical protein